MFWRFLSPWLSDDRTDETREKMIERNKIICCNVLEGLGGLPGDSIDCCVTSPPYWGLRDYNVNGQIGLESTLEEYIARLTQVFHEIKRVLKPDGSLWLNMGDAYGGPAGNNRSGFQNPKDQSGMAIHSGKKQPKDMRAKDLIGQPWRLALALQADGWYLRSDIVEKQTWLCPCCGEEMEIVRQNCDRDIIWEKPNPMPESVTDRPTKAHEYLFLMTKNPRYFYDSLAIRESASAGTANGAALGGSALTPEMRSALNANNVTTNLRGRLDFRKPEITINGTVTRKALDLKIVKCICFEIIVEQTERQYVMNLEPCANTASLTDITTALQGAATGGFPIRATIINTASAPSMAIGANPVNTIPLIGTSATTKNMLQVRPEEQLTRITPKGFPALLALHFNETSAPFFVKGTFMPSHMRQDTRNIQENQGRNKRTVWTIATQPMPDAHFATFPEKLVEPCILAGTSERGYCSECGRPWVRIVEKAKVPYVDTRVHGKHKGVNESKIRGGDLQKWLNEHPTQTIGWKAECNCNAKTVPGLVLDPFMGSGTVALVAYRLDRDFIGFELSKEYCEMAQKRIAAEVDQGRLFVEGN